MPSVPKYFLAIFRSFAFPDCTLHPQRIDRLRHIVHPHDAGTARHREHGSRHTPAVRRSTRAPPGRRSSACARRRRVRDIPTLPAGATPEQRQIVLKSFAEPESRIDDDPLGVDAGVSTPIGRLAQKRRDLFDDIAVVGRRLHRPWLALHVHETHRSAARGHRRGEIRSTSARTSLIIDAPCRNASWPRWPCWCRPRRWYRAGRGVPRSGSHGRSLHFTDRERARSSRLPAHVDEVGAGLDHRDRARDGRSTSRRPPE